MAARASAKAGCCTYHKRGARLHDPVDKLARVVAVGPENCGKVCSLWWPGVVAPAVSTDATMTLSGARP